MISNKNRILLLATACLLLVELAHGFEFKDCFEPTEQEQEQDQLAELKSILVSTCANTQGEFCTIPRSTNISIPATVVPRRYTITAFPSLSSSVDHLTTTIILFLTLNCTRSPPRECHCEFGHQERKKI